MRLRISRAGVVALLAFSGLAVAQPSAPGAELGLGTRIGIRFAVALVVNLLLGGALIGLSPRYATKMVGEIRADPGGAFVAGLAVAIGVPIGLGLLAITVIGLLVTIPGLFILAFVALIGDAVTVVWIGASLTGDTGTLGGKDVGVGAVVLALLFAVPLLGNLIATLAGFVGIGAVSVDLYDSWRS